MVRRRQGAFPNPKITAPFSGRYSSIVNQSAAWSRAAPIAAPDGHVANHLREAGRPLDHAASAAFNKASIPCGSTGLLKQYPCI